ncbi:hypothetical protein JXQ31_15020 [candidate division KSB1 bacterium]|nr:hypothetical protein [candidate division KSB1 bacterium]
MQRIRILLIIVMIFSTISSVSGRTLKNRFTGMGYVTIGQQYINTTGFKSILQSSTIQYPDPVESLFAFGGGGLFLINKWVVSGEGAGLSSAQETTNGYKTKLGGGFVKLELGRLLFENKSLHIYPLLGVGSCVFNYKINKDTKDLVFEDIINNPLTGTNMSTNNFFFNASLGIDYNINLRGSDIDEANIVFGIRAGYNYSTGAGDWKINGTSENLPEGPDIGLEGLYFNLIFGISGSNFEDEE